MSLTTDVLALGAATAVAAGSAIQVRQAFADLNAKTPLINSVSPLLWAAVKAFFAFMFSGASATTTAIALVDAGLLSRERIPKELTPEEFAALTPEEAATLNAGSPTALTAQQKAQLDGRETVTLTSEQGRALSTVREAARAKDLKKWLNWFLGWSFIMIGALAAVAGAALTLVNDL